MSLRDLALGIGDDADKAMEGGKGGARVNYFRLKDGETARVVFLGEPVTFIQHNDFNAGIKSHACIDPKGTNGTCPSCKRGVKKTKKVLLSLWNIESGQLEWAIFNRKEYAAYKQHIDNYGTDELAFISVSGKGTDKTTTVGPVPPKIKAKAGHITVVDEAHEQATDEDTILRAMFVLEPEKIERLLNGQPISDKANAEAKATESAKPVGADDDDVPF